MIHTHQFDTFVPGPHLVIFGAVHGNEKCGTTAINQFIQQLDSGEIKLRKGRLTCVPICNPKAYEQNTRFVDRNLNRALYIKEKPEAYEDFIDPIICRILDQADALLDLHSYASQGTEFGFLGHSTQAEIDYCRSLGINDFVYGWSQAFGKEADIDSRESVGTTEYARSKGCIATTIECGHHHNSDAADIALRTIHHALSHMEMIEPVATLTKGEQRFVQMRKVFYKQKEGSTAKAWKHYDTVSQGEILATYEDGETLNAPEDGVIILPKLDVVTGSEWFFFGVQTDCPKADKG